MLPFFTTQMAPQLLKIRNYSAHPPDPLPVGEKGGETSKGIGGLSSYKNTKCSKHFIDVRVV